MRFLVLVKASKESEAGALPSKELLAKMGAFNEEMVKAGVMLSGEGIHPTSKGARIAWAGGKPTVTGGPFPQSQDLVAGFWMLQAKSKEEAIEWISRAPFGDGANVEIRQVFEAEDFGAEFTPELREQEERHRAELASRR